MTDVTNALEAVSALIGERSKYEGWITALASKADVPPHVLEKVRNDYISRLRTVLQGFTVHTPELEKALAEHQSRDAALAAQEKTCRDEHAEGELRHMVGEFDDEQWSQVRVGHEAQLARLAQDREQIATDLANVQRGLAAAHDATQRARALGDAGTAPVSATTAADSPTPAVNAAMAAAPTAAPEPVRSAPAPAPAPAPAAYRPEAASAPERRPADDMGFLRQAAATPSVDNSSRAPEAPALRIVSDSPASAVAAATPPGTPSSADAAKTLRCAECGTMNYATEWYCERCGGELAVL
ncbi:MAG: zinc finger Ran-binding domain-containing family 2 protein [Gemmatimonadaceae bacterium]|nr:zinc finger Ran-binding domain-containing family 2 protein [Gemmatimonadaceae bacterium]